MLDYNIYELKRNIQNLRNSFLKRKLINDYKTNGKGTPEIIDKILNSFDRKIKSKPIFKQDIKEEYFKRLNEIFFDYYKTLNEPKQSKKDLYLNYVSDMYILHGKEKYKSKCMTYKDFIKNRGRKNFF